MRKENKKIELLSCQNQFFIGNLMNLILENFVIGKINNDKKKTISLKHLKLPKNHFKTNLFSIQLKHFKSTFTFVKKMKI